MDLVFADGTQTTVDAPLTGDAETIVAEWAKKFEIALASTRQQAAQSEAQRGTKADRPEIEGETDIFSQQYEEDEPSFESETIDGQ